MTRWTYPILCFIVLFATATGIFSAYTFGEVLSPTEPAPLGFAGALFAAVFLVWFVFFFSPTTNTPIGLALIGSGSLVFVVALVLQLYLAVLNGENNRRLGELAGITFARGMSNFNMNFAPYPKSVQTLSYAAFFIGAAAIAVGVRVGVGRASVVASVPLPPGMPSAMPVEPPSPS